MASVKDIYPLSPAQQGLLFHTLAAPNSGMYVEQFSVRLEGTLDPVAFRLAWQRLVARHEVLRSAVEWEELDVPLQLVFDEVDLPWREEDWRGLTGESQQERLEALLLEQRTEGFDLGQAPLMRVTLLRLADDAWQVVWNHHHLVLDGWSAATVLSELFTCYAALSTGREPELVPARQYRDYIAWLSNQDLNAAEKYWRSLLRGVTGPTPLGIDLAGGEERRDEDYGRCELTLTADLGQRLEGLARQRRLTVSTLFQAAWALLLSRYSALENVVFGVTSSGRPPELPGVEQIVGLFINTLPTRVDCPADEQLGQWLDRVQQAQVEQRQYEASPLPSVQSWSEVPRGSALFDSILVFENFPADPSVADTVPGLRVAGLRSVEQTNYPLTLLVVPGERATLKVWFDRTMIDAARAERLLGHMRTLLEELTGDQRRPLRQLSPLTPDERRELAGWASTAADYGPVQCVHQPVARQAAATPLAVAVRCGDRELTYAELDERANRLAHYLVKQGVGRDRVVGICAHRSVELVVALLAVLRAGGAYLPMDPEHPAERLEFLLRDTGAVLVLTEQVVLGSLPAGVPALALDSQWELVSGHPATPVAVDVAPTDLAYVMYTSGSTGTPKGVMVEHRGVWNRLEWGRRRYPLTADDVVVQKTPYTFDVSVWEFFWPLMTGARLVLARPGGHRDPEYLVRLVREERVTTLHFVPSMLRHFLLAEGAGELPSVQRVFCSGEALTADLRDRFFEVFGPGVELHNLYGPTEASIEVTAWQCLPEHRGDPVVPIGHPIANTWCRILDQAGQPVPVGVPGELYLSGVNLARGYLGRPELTEERFVADRSVLGTPGTLLYRTGDLARWRADGAIEYLGRNDDQIKVRGQRVEPGEIEAVLRTHPAVREAAVVVRDAHDQQVLVAYVAPHEGRSVDEQALRDWAGERLPGYMVPAGVVELDRLPLSASGKVDRGALPGLDPTGGTEFVPARSEVEQVLAGIWLDLLGVDRVGVLDNFFALGGDSILSIQMVSRAAQEGVRLTPAQVFREQTVARLAEVAGQGPAVVAEQEPVVGPMALGPVQRWFLGLELAASEQFNQQVVLESSAPVRVEVLRRALGHLLERHDVLRARFAERDGGWVQWQVAPEEAAAEVVVVDGAGREPAQVMAEAVEAAHGSMDLERGPLLRAVVVDFGAEGPGQRVVVACHHLVVDAVSWRFLMEDLERAYTALAAGEEPVLPAKTTSFAEWTSRLAEYAGTEPVTGQAPYWQRILDTVIPLPVDDPEAPNSEADAAVHRIELSAADTGRLAGAAGRALHARVDELVLAACARALTEWAQVRQITVDVEGHGREPLFEDVDLSRTVGWFTAIRPVHLPVGGAGDEITALKVVKEALRAPEHHGIGYGLLRHLTDLLPEPHPTSPVLVNHLGQLDAGGRSDTAAEPVFTLLLQDDPRQADAARNPANARHHDLEINSGVHAGRLVIELTYSTRRHRASAITALADRVREHLTALAAHADQPRSTAHTPTDFPLAGVSQQQLDRLAARHGRFANLHPATAMQQGLLFHTLSAPESGVYFEQFSVRLEGTLDPVAFHTAWRHLVRRHEALRSAMEWEGLDTPLQVVFADVELPWTEEDWRDLAPARQQERLAALLAEQRVGGFDLTRAPLMRVTLLRLADAAWQVVWNHHHLLMDGWSSATVLQELFQIYVALAAGRPPELPAPRQYHEYIAWLQRQDLNAAEEYWRSLLDGVTEPTPLGVDRTAAEERGDEDYDRREIHLDAELGRRLDSCARERRLTVNTLFQAAWSLLLSRCSGKDDVVFGVTSSGRAAELTGVERIVGLFINTLPARVSCPPQTTVGAWLDALQHGQIQQRQFEFTPLPSVQAWSGVPRDSPLFESILVFENYPADFSVLDRLGDLRVADLHSMEQTNYPLTVVIVPGEQITLKIWFDRRRIDPATAERLLDAMRALLGELTGDAERPLRQIPLLTAEEGARLAEWNDTTVDFGSPRCLHQVISRQAAATPGAVAVRCADQELTYAQLDRRANQLARYLVEQQVGPGRLVAICAERSVELVVALLGVLKAGGAYLPLDPEYPADRLAFLVEDTGAALVLTQDRLREAVSAAVQVPAVALDTEWEQLVAPLPGGPVEDRGTPDDLAYVIYTSGSTGTPKGVMIEHRGIWNRLEWMQRAYPIGPSDTVVQKTPYTFDVSVWEFFWPLMTGARMVLARPGGHRDPEYLARLVREERVTTLHFVPSMLRYFQLADGAGDLPSVRRVFCSGEALTADLRDRFFELWPDAELHNLYGPTEASVDVTAWQCLPEHRGDPVVPIGRPIANMACRILDHAGQQAPVGVAGELHLAGVGLARGYLGRPDLTRERFVPDPFADPADPRARLYRTGDLARWRPDGTIEYLGRNDDQVKIRGQRVEPGEVEAALQDDPAVTHAAVLVDRREDGNAGLVAYVQPDFAALAELLGGDAPDTPEAGGARPAGGDAPAAGASASGTPATGTQSTGTSATGASRHVEQWRALYEQIYREPVVESAGEPEFNTAGWISSYTGEQIPDAQMREWRDRTVQRLTGLRPRRVLEIGCGTGILLLKIAPACEHYHGIDMSATALDYVDRQLAADPALRSRVTLEEGEAADLSSVPPGSVDLVVLNSVAQYFPDAGYLRTVLRRALDRLAPGGSLYVGDVRNLRLLETFHASVQLAGAEPALLAGEAVERVRRLTRNENELLVAPAFFTELRDELPGIARVDIEPKEADYDNELSRFRYDVLLTTAADPAAGVPAPVPARWVDWSAGGQTWSALVRTLEAGERELITLASVPNSRVLPHHRAWQALTGAEELTPLAELDPPSAAPDQPEAVDPQRLRDLGRSLGYEVELSWARGNPDGSFDAVLRRTGLERVEFQPPRSRQPQDPEGPTANLPARQELATRLRDRLLARLAARLPQHLVPSALTVLDTLPLTSSGKVDRRALRTRGDDRERPDTDYVAPRDAVELRLAGIWEQVLDVPRVGALDDFFALGGDSLTAIRLATEVQRAFGVKVSLAAQVAARTVADEAQLLRAEATGDGWRPLVTITPPQDPAGSGGPAAAPVFLVHPAGGSVMCYAELARRLGRDQPCYGLAPAGLEEGQDPDDDIPTMARRYLAEVRTAQPHGRYRLAGWSMGGVVAMEMARLLRAAGEDVAPVVMIDSTAPELVPDDADDADVLVEFFGEVPLDVEQLRAMGEEERLRFAMAEAERTNALPVGLDADRLRRMRRAHRAHIAALAAHRPDPYDGDVVLLRAVDTPITQPDYGWQPIVRGALRTADVPGNHQSVLAAPGALHIAGEIAAERGGAQAGESPARPT